MATPSSTLAEATESGVTEPAIPVDGSDRITGLEAVTVAFGLWTVAYLVGLALGVGWALALPLWLVLAAGVALVVRRDAAGGRPVVAVRARLGTPVGWLLASLPVIGWLVQSIGDGGRWVLAAVVVVGALVLRGETGPIDRRVGAGVAVALVAAAAHSLSWPAFIGVVSVVAIGSLALEFRSGGSTVGSPTAAGWAAEPPVLAIGLLFGLWTAFTRQFNPDDSYYANKAAHYADDPTRFRVENHQFGTPDEPHLPLADILSAFEPFAGLLSALTGLHHATVLYLVLAPAAAFAIPLAHRYAARAFGAKRPDAAALVGMIAILHLAEYGDFILLSDKIFQGKGVLVLVALPIATGSTVRYWRAPSTRRLIVAVGSVLAALGLTPTAGAPLVGAGLALLVAGLFVTRTDARFGGRTRLLGAAPFVVAFGFTLFAFAFQSSASQTDPTALRFAGAENSWARRLVTPRPDGLIDWTVPAFLVIFSLVVVIVLGRTPMIRVFFGLVAVGLFALLFNPLLFGPVFDDVLHLNFLSWRFGWILPTSLTIGLAFDALDRPLPVVGRNLGLGIVVVIVLAALPLLARTEQEYPAPWDLQNRWIRGADLIIEATPEGGRYLATERVEIATTMLTADIYPTYARQRFLSSYERAGASGEFDVELRNELARQIDGGRARVDPMEALDSLGIDTVCADPRVDSDSYPLRDALPEKFERGNRVRLCELWTRVVPAG